MESMNYSKVVKCCFMILNDKQIMFSLCTPTWFSPYFCNFYGHGLSPVLCLYVTFPWPVLALSLAFLWPILALSLSFFWTVLVLFMTFPWPVLAPCLSLSLSCPGYAPFLTILFFIQSIRPVQIGSCLSIALISSCLGPCLFSSFFKCNLFSSLYPST